MGTDAFVGMCASAVESDGTGLKHLSLCEKSILASGRTAEDGRKVGPEWVM